MHGRPRSWSMGGAVVGVGVGVVVVVLAGLVGSVAGDLCATTGLNGRRGAGTRHAVICTMNGGDRSKVVSYGGGWYRLKVQTGRCAGKTMYSYGKYLKNCGATRTECVTATALNVREGPSTKNKKVGLLKKGARVTNRGEYGGWAHVSASGVGRGFVAARYLGSCGGSRPSPPPPPPPSSSGGKLPPAPDTRGHKGGCTTKYGGYRGYCISVSKCTGGTFNGLCSARGTKCCVRETRAARPRRNHVSGSQFRALFENLSSARAGALLPYFNEAMDLLLADGATGSRRCHRIAAFAAQVGHESVGLLYFEEIASGAAYEGRCRDLGNCRSGDGRRFKGRGPIQLTGRANYRSAGRSLGRPFESNPELVNFPSGGFQAASWFWMSRGLNRYATGSSSAFVTMTRRINGGTNGLTDRQRRWARAKKMLGC